MTTMARDDGHDGSGATDRGAGGRRETMIQHENHRLKNGTASVCFFVYTLIVWRRRDMMRRGVVRESNPKWSYHPHALSFPRLLVVLITYHTSCHRVVLSTSLFSRVCPR